jgi:hypothetical protein
MSGILHKKRLRDLDHGEDCDGQYALIPCLNCAHDHPRSAEPPVDFAPGAIDCTAIHKDVYVTAPHRPVVIVADQYQFLDTVCGTTPATLQPWYLARTLDRLREFVTATPLAIVVDLEATSVAYAEALALLGSMAVAAPVVLLAGADIDTRDGAKALAKTLSLEVAGTLRRPLIMTALLRLLSSCRG